MSTARRRLSTWIACLAVLFASLAPTISHALAADSSAEHAVAMEICSDHNIPSAHSETATLPHVPTSSHDASHWDHCPFCRIHSDLPSLLPVAPLSVPALAVDATHPALFYHAPRPLFAWVAAQPRAPPALS